jgi:hypothetical protein
MHSIQDTHEFRYPHYLCKMIRASAFSTRQNGYLQVLNQMKSNEVTTN